MIRLSLKLGSVNVSTSGADIPVVLRSPIFQTTENNIPGSFIFNFTLPFTNELKSELSFGHRPARKGKQSVQKPFELRFGPLFYSGTATVTEMSEESIEISMPVDTGDIARVLKNSTLKDLNLDQQVTFEPKISYSQFSIDQNFFFEKPDFFIENIWIQPDARRIDTLNCLNMTNFQWTIPYDGDFNIKAVINSKFGTITMLGETFPAGTARVFEIYKNGIRIKQDVIESDSHGYDHTWTFNQGDFLTFCVAAYSVQGYGFQYVIMSIMGGSTIVIDDGSTPFQPEISYAYPDHNYTVFPVNNPTILGNIPESLYQIDFSDLQEYYGKFAPYINYYINGKFPYVIMGQNQGIWYALLNLFSPFPYVAYMIKSLFAHIGYNIINNVFTTNELRQLVYVHNYFINNYFYENTPITLNECMPEEPLSDFLKNITMALGLTFKVDSTRRKIEFQFIDDIITKPGAIEFSDNVIGKPLLQNKSYSGYSVKYTPVDCDYLKKYVKTLDGLTIKGSVTIINDLSGITDPQINDCYYVTTRHAWYVWNYDPEMGVLNWVFHSFDFALEVKDIDENSENEPFTIENKLNTVLMDYWHPIDGNGDKTISAPMRDWHVPLVHHAGNFKQLPEAYRGDHLQALLFYWGRYLDSNGDNYPFASNDVYDYAGNRITDQGLRLESVYGIFNNKLKRFVDFVLKSPGDFIINKQLTPLEIAQLDFFEWHRVHGVDFLLKEVRFNIREDHISTSEIIAVRRNMDPDS
jgi:hypothetical protein